MYLYLFLQFELGNSQEINNQEMKENRAFTVLFIIKIQEKGKQTLHELFFETPIEYVQR